MSNINITPLNREYIIDLSSNNNFVQVPAVQGDGNYVRYVTITLTKYGEEYIIPANVTASIIGTKPDGNQIFNICKIEDNKIIVELTSQMLAVPGRGNYSIKLNDNTHNSSLTSFPFYVITTETTYDIGEIMSSDEYRTLDEMISRAQTGFDDAIAVCHAYADAAGISADAAKGSEDNAKDSENSAKTSELAAKQSEDNAKDSEDAAKASELAAKDSETAAKASEVAAKASETSAAGYANEAQDSADNASSSEANARTYMTNAKTYQAQAKLNEIASGNSATAADNAAQAAAGYATQTQADKAAAAASATAAATSEINAQTAATNAKTSEDNAKDSETNAANSVIVAKEHEDAAKLSADNAKESEDNAKDSETNAANSAATAKTHEDNAKDYADAANASKTAAQTSETNSATSVTNAQEYAEKARKWAGGGAAETPTDDNNAKYWSDSAKSLFESAGTGLNRRGSVRFANLPVLPDAGWTYQIVDDFTTDSRFEEGTGVQHESGTTVYYNTQGTWSILYEGSGGGGSPGTSVIYSDDEPTNCQNGAVWIGP